MTQPAPIVDVYTDGSCLKNPGGPGGWGVVVSLPDGVANVSGRLLKAGFAPTTTNNQMEMTAACMGLRVLKDLHANEGLDPSAPWVLYSDSEYVIKGMTEWMSGWKRRGWVNARGKPVENQDLWRALDAAQQGMPIVWKWVRGHAGNPLNELADQLANTAARKQSDYFEPPTGQAELTAIDNPSGRAGPVEMDPGWDDALLADAVRQAMYAARGRIVRIREAAPRLTQQDILIAQRPRG